MELKVLNINGYPQEHAHGKAGAHLNGLPTDGEFCLLHYFGA